MDFVHIYSMVSDNTFLLQLEIHIAVDRDLKEPVKLIKRMKIAHSFLQSVSNQFHFIILSFPM